MLLSENFGKKTFEHTIFDLIERFRKTMDVLKCKG